MDDCLGWQILFFFWNQLLFFLTSSAVILSVSPWISYFVLLTRGEKQLSNTARVFHWEPQEHESRKAQLTVKHLLTCLYGIQLHWWCMRHQSFHRVQAGHSRPCDPCLLDECGLSKPFMSLGCLWPESRCSISVWWGEGPGSFSMVRVISLLHKVVGSIMWTYFQVKLDVVHLYSSGREQALFANH